MSRFVLKPSALSKQASKLEYYAEDQASAKKPRLDGSEDAKDDKNGETPSSSAAGGPFAAGVVPPSTSTTPRADTAENDRVKIGASYFRTDQAPSGPPAAANQFVFGTNLSDRVMGFEASSGGESKSDGVDLSNGSTNLFSAAASTVVDSSSAAADKSSSNDGKEDSGSSSPASTPNNKTKSLTDSAAEYERRIAEEKEEKLRLLSNDVVVTTGEEAERNVLQLTCKLYTFDAAERNWVERGRGELHLNDAVADDGDGGADGRPPSSRIVIRTQGSLRVVLNSRLFPEMTARKVRQRTVEFTAVDSAAMDGDEKSSTVSAGKPANDAEKRVKVFLVQLTNAHDADTLQRHLETRIKGLQDFQSKSSDPIANSKS